MPTTTETDEKAIKRSVSWPPALLAAAQAEADAHHGGNLSRYVQQLAQADLSEKTTATPIIDLAQAFHPTLANSLAHQLMLGTGDRAVNQARAIARFLEALTSALEGHFDPEQPYRLLDARAAVAASNLDEVQLARIAEAVALRLEPSAHAVAEPQGKKPKAYPQGSFPSNVKIQPPDGRALIRDATSKHPASSSKSKAS